ncbi:MAG TPA: hypothetical protein DCE44_03145, partial [Verrucomicrobiales bacterium]|nr:hypothetical protein [Verrucomicrobiales bacterium]
MSGSNWIKFNRGWWSPYLLCILTAASATPESPNLRRPDLTGTVRDEDGKPVAAASVFIYTAGPKEGVGILCPSCYADCRKRTRTDGDGHFKIESLDPALQFRLLVVARGHRPEFVGKVDPAKRPVEVTLAPGKTDVSPDLQVKGRVVDSERKPVSGAVISIREVKRGESTQYGGNEDIDRVAVSDDEGLFVVNGENRFDAVGVEIEARALAKGIFHELATGGKIHELQLTEGAAVHGRVIKNGKPLGGVEIGICGADRTAEEYVGDFSVGTDKEGRFSLGNLPPNRDYFVYAKMSSLAGKDSLPARRVKLKRDASSEDLGDLAVSPGFTLTGQIQLTDGNSVPPKTRLLLSRDEAWDSAQTEADERGRFTFRGVPPESFGLSARIKGYRLSARNRSLDTMNPFHLVGVIKADKTDLILEFEPEKNPSPRLGNYVEMRQEPLLGAELVKNRVGDIQVTGTVSDAESGKPIKRFTITEGRAGNFPQPTQWFPARQTEGANGKLDLFLNRHGSAPVILVEAEGYLPQASGAITGAETNLAFALKKGVGPSGVILKPNGEPAAGATVYLADMQNGVYVQDKSMKVQDHMYQGL